MPTNKRDFNRTIIRKKQGVSLLVFSFALLINGLFLYYFTCEYLFGMEKTIKTFTGLYFVIFSTTCFIGFWLKYGRRFRITLMDWIFLGFASLVIVSLLFNISSENGDYAKWQLIFFALYGIMAYITGRMFPREQLLKLALFIIVIGVAEIAASFFALSKLGWSLKRGEFYLPLWGNPLWMGAIYLRIILASFIYLIYVKMRNKVHNRMLLQVVLSSIILLSFFLLLLTAARQMVIGLFLALIFIFTYVKSPMLKKLKWAFFIFSSLLIIGYLLITNFPDVLYHYQILLSEVDTSSQLRIIYIKNAWNAFTNNPIFGVGAGTITNFPHNLYLHTAAELGLGGLFYSLILTIPIIFLIFRYRYNKNDLSFSLENLFLFCLFITVFFSSLVSGTPYNDFGYYIVLGMIVSAFPSFFTLKIKNLSKNNYVP